MVAEAGDKLVAVDFTATWCPPCRRIGPVFESMAEDNEGVVFIKVDVDDNSETSEACEINCMPTFQFYKNGKKLDEFSGADENMLKEKVQTLQ